MLRLLKNLIIYSVLVAIALEILVRVFHLYNDLPQRYVDDNINKWIPGQTGYAVYGNRVQNKAAYHINESGYNSYREFCPTYDKFELALIGDSYIEGFHQPYYSSIGKLIEREIPDMEVYEYGHSSNDFADQLFLVFQDQAHFEKIDRIVYYIKFANDLDRDEYKHITHQPLYMSLRKSKLLEYTINIGAMDPVKDLVADLRTLGRKKATTKKSSPMDEAELEAKRIANFDTLCQRYGFDKEKSAILLDSRITPQSFMNHLEDKDIEVLDFAQQFESAGGKRRTTLIYDQHWNGYGRRLIAEILVDYLQGKREITIP